MDTGKYVSVHDFTPADFFKYSFGITQLNDGKAETVELLFKPLQAPYILSQPLHHSQHIISNDEDGLRIRMKVYITQELIMCILSYAANVKVLAPKKLLLEITGHIKEMGTSYLK